MGYSNGGNEFTPDNDETTLYIECRSRDIPFNEVLEQIKSHFGADVDLETVSISSENIHTRCRYYDLHDSSDWDQYLVISRSV
ncbi:hypothetical protein XaC1_498 [Xanthomonas phage XaC1]|nr:hypothetical protein XaC1_498 [Xanthomonas phage XaC1]